jgi:hypothetical protein
MTGAGSGQPGVELADGQAGEGIAPRWGDLRGGSEHEVAGAEQRVRDGQAGRGVSSGAPQDQVKVEHARGPAPAAPAAAELALEALEQRKERGGLEWSLDHGGGIRVAPERGADRIGQQHRCRVAHLHALTAEALKRGGKHVTRAAEPVMAPVGAERDQVGMRQIYSQMRP